MSRKENDRRQEQIEKKIKGQVFEKMISKRPEGMSQEEYKKLLKAQKKSLKIFQKIGRNESLKRVKRK